MGLALLNACFSDVQGWEELGSEEPGLEEPGWEEPG